MLHKDPFIIAPETFSLIRELQALPALKNFYLVGGTALALQLGHRNSIDIDLFTRTDFDSDELLVLLEKKYKVETRFKKGSTIISLVNNIKTDFIRHDYPLVNQPITEEEITFLSKEDIAAMKVHAITQSGKRVKDFIDIYFLLEYFTMNEIMGFFAKKYPGMSVMIAMKAIHYFEDIDEQIDPPRMKKPLPFEKIKARILQAILQPSKTF